MFNRTIFAQRPDVLIVGVPNTVKADALDKLGRSVRRSVRYARRHDVPIVIVTNANPDTLTIGWL
jgi:hypothetical protein